MDQMGHTHLVVWNKVGETDSLLNLLLFWKLTSCILSKRHVLQDWLRWYIKDITFTIILSLKALIDPKFVFYASLQATPWQSNYNFDLEAINDNLSYELHTPFGQVVPDSNYC